MLLVFPRLEAGPDFARLDVWPGRAELCPGLLPRCDGNLVPSALVVGMMCMRASEIFGRLAELVPFANVLGFMFPNEQVGSKRSGQEEREGQTGTVTLVIGSPTAHDTHLIRNLMSMMIYPIPSMSQCECYCPWNASQCVSYALLSPTRYKT